MDIAHGVVAQQVGPRRQRKLRAAYGKAGRRLCSDVCISLTGISERDGERTRRGCS